MPIKRDWDSAALISDQLREIVDRLHILMLASYGFEENPGGIDELFDRAEVLANEWHDYSAKLDNDV